MEREKIELTNSPSDIVSLKTDCLWICLGKRNKLVPLKSKVLQTLDWNLGGAISKALIKGSVTSEKPIFLPAMSRVAPSLLVLDGSGSVNWKKIKEVGEGLKLKTLTLVSDDISKGDELYNSVKENELNFVSVSVVIESE